MRREINLCPNSANTLLTMKKICITFLILAAIAVITAPAYAAKPDLVNSDLAKATYEMINLKSGDGTFAIKVTPRSGTYPSFTLGDTYSFSLAKEYDYTKTPVPLSWDRKAHDNLPAPEIFGYRYAWFSNNSSSWFHLIISRDKPYQPIALLKGGSAPYEIIDSSIVGATLANFQPPSKPYDELFKEYNNSGGISEGKENVPPVDDGLGQNEFDGIDGPQTVPDSSSPSFNIHEEVTAEKDPLNSVDCTVDGGLIGLVLGNCTTPPGPDQVKDLFIKATQFLLSIAAIVAVIMIIINAYKLMSSMGNEEMAGAGKSGLTATITGLIIIMLAKFILQVVTWVLGGG
ncbi:MAG: hypothetical protein UT66_C0015G0011 [candidate division CPR2 bacterium GW2011_GWC1_39_9]|uniref:Uncharacterized protein n=1 Tax=candidate division CPR2 bacterium GW2011_GWC2_39_10 TaxID=1618345 RepID=A0A0G0PZX1_UNCC2|nr:MAG: hypothetical protein UT18_C0005G0011 [candidate division CPR2 bacterium GW2011_GWC2_39_10]KKR34847.1 MAG: hypothetical protein UT66_C0015G0011 [candidate division CPR2 bacterium GW2011_GWC1_39_9]